MTLSQKETKRKKSFWCRQWKKGHRLFHSFMKVNIGSSDWIFIIASIFEVIEFYIYIYKTYISFVKLYNFPNEISFITIYFCNIPKFDVFCITIRYLQCPVVSPYIYFCRGFVFILGSPRKLLLLFVLHLEDYCIIYFYFVYKIL